ncbi:uncharacterized protein PHALS_13250 [Plasmopara halstedii]|uniref:RxLR-like protein n=1 Tax=Plasmopara halstedii TaxID=4781 RepID=A0A0P1APN3_PLAHL|nr:uncharacterized protein PHALS_13250 [Plasmopara halstedii]CEG43025.1 hypothetical protein PHALS_13250 [Plasmopara halstedii]|eukprot:XP_024579394.1 hypothetical protein PHALS_13250 [Plasmopara halstedii]
MNSKQSSSRFLYFPLFVSVAIIACIKHDFAEAKTYHNKVVTTHQVSRALTTSHEERVGPFRTEAQQGWLTHLYRNILEMFAPTSLVKLENPTLSLKHAKYPEVIAGNLFEEYHVDTVLGNFFVSEPFTHWSGVITTAFKDKPEEGYRIVLKILEQHDSENLIKFIAETKTSMGSTTMIKGIERAMINECVQDMNINDKLVNLYEYEIIQELYRISRETFVVQLQTKLDKTPALRKQVDRAVAEAETLGGYTKSIAEDVQSIFAAETLIGDTERIDPDKLVLSASLPAWLAVLKEKGFEPMAVLTARLKDSSYKGVLALCRTNKLSFFVRSKLENFVSEDLFESENFRQWCIFMVIKTGEHYPEVQNALSSICKDQCYNDIGIAFQRVVFTYHKALDLNNEIYDSTRTLNRASTNTPEIFSVGATPGENPLPSPGDEHHVIH